MSTMTRKPRTVKPKAAPVVSLALAIDHVVYQVEPIPAGEFGSKAFRLVKRAGDGAVYDVVRTHDGLVECDCPSYETTYRGTCGTCKHGSAMIAVGLIDAPAWTPPARETTPATAAPVPHVADEFDAPAPVVVAEVQPAPLPVVESPAVAPSEGFADELAEVVGPIASPSDDDEDTGARRRIFGSGILDPEDEGLSNRLATVATAEVETASLRPVRLAPLPPGRYDLAGLIEGQAAFLAGQGSAPFALMSRTLMDLARSIRQSGAKTVADFEDRIAEMERDRDAAIADRAYADGFDSAMREHDTACYA